MADISIHTLNSRENVMLEVLNQHFDLSHEQMHGEINRLHRECKDILKKKGIAYDSLKNALIPKIDRKEIAWVFDTTKVENAWYARPILESVLSSLSNEGSHSILVGDIIDFGLKTSIIADHFHHEINPFRAYQFKHPTQFYVVYLNNLTDNRFNEINAKLQDFEPCVGYFDVTNNSFIKVLFSTSLVKLCVKKEKVIILPHEEDRNDEENVNLSSYDYEKFGFSIRSIRQSLFDLFLSYKIEREVYPGFESDSDIGLMSITTDVQDFGDFELIIDEAKFNYLLENHWSRIKKAGMDGILREKLEAIIREKIKKNYIYNLSYSDQFDVIKFNLNAEFYPEDSDERIKILVSLKYLPHEKQLRLITMY